MITLRVPHYECLVHKALLCHFSKYCDRALNGPFKESKTGIAVIEDLSIEAIQVLIGWLYTGNLKGSYEEPGWRDTYPESCTLEVEDLLFDLYVFGDKWDMPIFCNAVLSKMHEYYYEEEHGDGSLYSRLPSFF